MNLFLSQWERLKDEFTYIGFIVASCTSSHRVLQIAKYIVYIDIFKGTPIFADKACLARPKYKKIKRLENKGASAAPSAYLR